MLKAITLTFTIFIIAQAIKLQPHQDQIIHQITIIGKIKSPCPEGQTPYDKGLTVSVNGCGSGWQSKFSKYAGPYASKFTSCCNEHDRCFGQCGYPDFEQSFDECNSDFKECMYDICGDLAGQAKWYLKSTIKHVCRANASAFYNAVDKMGKTFYEQSQKKYCGCE